jgi:HNH endonuclease
MTEKEIRAGANGTDQGLVKRTAVQNTLRRVCSRCHEEKPLELFASDCWRPGGHRPTCADCRSEYDSKRYYRQRCRWYGIEPVVEPFSRTEVIKRYGDRCAYCTPGDFESLDHFVPVAAGGPHTLDNVRPSCRSCNSTKFWSVDQALIREFRRSRVLVGASQ